MASAAVHREPLMRKMQRTISFCEARNPKSLLNSNLCFCCYRYMLGPLISTNKWSAVDEGVHESEFVISSAHMLQRYTVTGQMHTTDDMYGSKTCVVYHFTGTLVPGGTLVHRVNSSYPIGNPDKSRSQVRRPSVQPLVEVEVSDGNPSKILHYLAFHLLQPVSC